MLAMQQVEPTVGAAQIVLEPLGYASPVEEVAAQHLAHRLGLGPGLDLGSGGVARLVAAEERLYADAALGAAR